MGFKCGIVGLPNVGKSTLFNALTQAGVEAANYPFCTIEPHVGMVPMPDPRLTQIAEIAGSAKIIPTTMEFVDIAGLVAGASKGEGLGNQFLANIRETEAIAHVVRCFQNDDITHVAGKVDPRADVQTIQTELCLADLETVEKALLRVNKNAKAGDKQALAEKDALESARALLNEAKPTRFLSAAHQAALAGSHLLTLKPVLYIANVDENGFQQNPYLDELQELAAEEQATVVPVCAALEAELTSLSETEKQEFLQSMGLAEPGLNRVIRAGYALLNLETYFTAGPKEARAWTILKNSTAPQAAGKIHTDFEKGFIRAEVISYTDFITYRGEAGAKEAGKWRLEGKEYIVRDGDVIHFRFNVN